MSLHDEIMNLQGASQNIQYKIGHRDARHSAAELSINMEVMSDEQTEEIARLTAELARVKERAAMYDVVRKLQPLEFTNMFVSNIKGFGRFDDLVRAEMLAAAPKPPGAA